MRARDDAGNCDRLRGRQHAERHEAVAQGDRASRVQMAGAPHGGAARYSLAGPARLLLDVRIVGTLQKAKLRALRAERPAVASRSGAARRARPRRASGLHSTLVRHGFVTIKLNRALHAGRTRLVLIASSRVVIAGNGAHKPTMQAG